MSSPTQGPRFAYENPADLTWGAQMVQTWAKRRRAREAAERDHGGHPKEAPARAVIDHDDATTVAPHEGGAR